MRFTIRFFRLCDQNLGILIAVRLAQDGKSLSVFGLERPVGVAPSIPDEPQQEFALVASMDDMPELSGQKVAIGAWHVPASLPVRKKCVNGCSLSDTTPC
jgi:hypothetical protein